MSSLVTIFGNFTFTRQKPLCIKHPRRTLPPQ